MLRNMKIGTKLLIMIIIPIVGLLVFAALDIAEKVSDLRNLSTTSTLTTFAVRSGGLIQELQKERGLSAGFLASKGEKFRSELTSQRSETDTQLKALKEYYAAGGNQLEEIKGPRSTADTMLEKLSTTRGVVDTVQIAPQEAITYYTKTISLYLDVIAQLGIMSRNTEISRDAMTYHAFLSAKEQAGRERATLNGAFAANRFDDETYRRFIGIMSSQTTFLDLFSKFAREDHLQEYKEKMNAPFIGQVDEMRAVALTKGVAGDFGIQPEIWFKTITAKINAMKEVEDLLAKNMGEKADELAAAARKSLIFSVIFSSVATFITLFFSFFIMLGITSPLKAIVGMLKDVAEGEGDLTKRLNADRKDEIGEVSLWFNRFVDNIQSIISQVAGTTTQVASSSGLLQDTADQIATAAEEVAGQSVAVATASEEMSATSNDISRNCSLAAEISSRAGDTARGGAQVVQETLQGMHSIAESVQESARTVESLGQRSDQIGAIVGTIEDIADQTNLLALNAASEAARAGEQGRGFAVVADEVRALADRTTKATREIGIMIKAIQSETSGAVASMKNGVCEVEKGMESSRRSGEALDDILNAINDVTMQVHQIATAAEEQTATTSEISNNISQITEVVSETAQGAHATATAASHLSILAAELQGMVGRFKLS